MSDPTPGPSSGGATDTKPPVTPGKGKGKGKKGKKKSDPPAPGGGPPDGDPAPPGGGGGLMGMPHLMTKLKLYTKM